MRELDIEPLARVNLIVGENNVGKTALLEALYLSLNPGNPDATLRVNHSRGVRGNQADIWDELGWLFYRKQTLAGIELLCKDEGSRMSALRIRLAEPKERLLVAPDADDAGQIDVDMLTALAQSSLLKLEYTDYTGQEHAAHAQLLLGGISSSSVIGPPSRQGCACAQKPPFLRRTCKTL